MSFALEASPSLIQLHCWKIFIVRNSIKILNKRNIYHIIASCDLWSLVTLLEREICSPFYDWDFLVDSDSKESACNAVDLGSIPGLERSPGEGNGSPLQYSCLENPMDRGVWWATVHGVAKSWTQLRLNTACEQKLKVFPLEEVCTSLSMLH